MELSGLPYQEPQPKRHWFNDPDKIRLLAAILTIGAAGVNAFGRSQKTTWFLLAGIAVLLLSLIVPVISRRIRERSLLAYNRRFVAREHNRLERFFEKFLRICLNRNDSRAFHYILYQSQRFQHRVFTGMIRSDFISSWASCFGLQLKSPCHELKPFLAKCNEFSVIIRQFDQEYVVRLQKGLDAIPRECPDEFEELERFGVFDDLEAFREEFAQFLREVEEWIETLRREATKQLTYAEQAQNCPSGDFERAKSFVPKRTTEKDAAR